MDGRKGPKTTFASVHQLRTDEKKKQVDRRAAQSRRKPMQRAIMTPQHGQSHLSFLSKPQHNLRKSSSFLFLLFTIV
jgi:hypothetical protein